MDKKLKRDTSDKIVTIKIISSSTKLETYSVDVPYDVICQSGSGSDLIRESAEEEDEDTYVYPLMSENVDPETLEKMLVFAKHHHNDPMPAIDFPIHSEVVSELVLEWDANYIDCDVQTLEKLTKLADYLGCTDLLNLCCVKCAAIIRNKTPNEIKAYFGIVPNPGPGQYKELSPQEVEQFYKDNGWNSQIIQ